jgi:hypothetical protein
MMIDQVFCGTFMSITSRVSGPSRYSVVYIAPARALGALLWLTLKEAKERRVYATGLLPNRVDGPGK